MGCLEVVEVGYDDVYQDYVGFFLVGQGDVVVVVFGFEYLVIMFFQYGGQFVYFGWRVINN